MKVEAVNLANNHIQDKGILGISDTIHNLQAENINCFGAGISSVDAKKPYGIDSNTVIFGYCDHDQSYLRQVVVANVNSPGLNSLRYKNIIDDLNVLKENQKAILYFHWGREHVFLPPHKDIELAKKLLEDDRVLLIIGMHAHRIQGYIEHNNKRAYMCLGNFLFPNFYINPPTQLYYPKNTNKKIDITKQYHRVFKPTYKMWRYINRVSLILQYYIKQKKISHQFVIQNNNYPILNELKYFQKFIFYSYMKILCLIYRAPKFIYIFLERMNASFMAYTWRYGIYFFYFKQLGPIETIRKILKKIRRKF